MTRSTTAQTRSTRTRASKVTTVAMIATVTMITMVAACGDDRDSSNGNTGGTDDTTAVSAPDTDGSGGTASSTPAAPDTSTPQPVGDPDPSEVAFTEVAGDLDRPVDMAWRSGDPDPFVVLQRGTVVRLHDGSVGDTVLDVRTELGDDNEQGLLSVAFHPTDATLAYTFTTARDGTLTVTEYTVADDGTFDRGSRRIVLEIDHPRGNHNGGQLAFGPDGYLYIGTGDGGAADDPDRAALDLGELLGKILRIDPAAAGNDPYTVPADNPFVDTDGARPEIWAYGLRNPWRFSFDPATGDLWIGDVGQGDWEEINLARAADGGGRGLNFGWSAFEGTHRFNDDQPDDGVTMPVHEYSHNDGGCSVTGGEVYRGDAAPSLAGWLLFSDFCDGRIIALRVDGPNTSTVDLTESLGNVAAIVSSPDGTVYVLDHADSRVLQLSAA